MINRSAVLLKYRDPAVNWINEADPYHDDPDITKERVNEDRIVYLISEDDGDTPDKLESWLSKNYETLFELELEAWYADETLWPENRTLALFKNWFKVECHTLIEDTVGGKIYVEDV